MTLDQNIRLFRKWWWLIVMAALVAGAVGYLLRNRQAPVYQATVTLAFGNLIGNANPDSSSFTVGTDLANTYAELVKTNTIMNGTLAKLHLPISADTLQSDVEYKVISSAALLQISVNYSDPVLSASIANEIANELQANAQTSISTDQQQQVQQINTQIGKLNAEITDTEQRLTTINTNLEAAQTAIDINDLTAQREVTTNQLTSLQATLSQFETTLTALQGRQSPVQIYERAAVPTGPVPVNAIQSALLAAAVAASLTFGVVLLVTYFDNTNVHTADEIGRALNLPVLGTLIRYGRSNESYRDKLVTRQPQNADVLETYRLLFMRLTMSPRHHWSQSGAPSGIFMISSPAPGDGKSVVSANLAVTAALFGLRVLLIDADLHQPTLHKFFNLENTTGLADLVSNAHFVAGFTDPTLRSAALPPGSELALTLENYIQHTDVPNLSVLTAGDVSATAAQSMSLLFQPQWVTALKTHANVDMIIFDTPPCLAVADSSVLAAKTQARVVLVLLAGRTAIRTAIKAKEQFVKVDARLEGIVLNMAENHEVEFDYKNYGMIEKLSDGAAKKSRAAHAKQKQ